MYISCLATDYDGTLAHAGVVDEGAACLPRQMVDCGAVEDTALQRTCSTCKDPAGNGWSSAASGLLRLSHPPQSSRSRTIIWRLWIGSTSGPGVVVSRVKAAPLSGMGRQSPAKQNQSSPAFVNFHFDFGDF